MTPPEPRRAVYTALIGGYESLLEQPQALVSDVPFICFTDDPTLVSETWDVRVIDRVLDADRVRSARHLKIMGHDDLEAFDETLWIDNSVLLKADPRDIMQDWLLEADIAMPAHEFRDSVDDEFTEVARLGRDHRARVYEQREHYREHAPEVLSGPVLWTALLARRRTRATEKTMITWMIHVLRYSRRDQLSVTYAIAQHNASVNVIDLDSSSSLIHEWPVAPDRVHRQGVVRGLDDPDAEELSIADLYHEIDGLKSDFQVQMNHVKAASANEVAVKDAQLSEIVNSTSWRLMRRVHGVVSAVRGAVKPQKRTPSS